MRLGTIRDPAGGTRAAVLQDGSWTLLDAADVGALVADAHWSDRVRAALRDAAAPRVDPETSTLIRPVTGPAKIVCCGLNYADHIAETGRDTPRYPTLFAKYADTLTDPDAVIEVSGSAEVDWEAELAVVIGRPVRRADPATAEAAILGYTVANDVSLRDWQARTLEWFQGKAWDRTTPVGPVVVTADELSPADGLAIETRIGDEVMQRSSTRELVFRAADLVSYVSQFTRLSPGDLILTGTPGGVGLGRDPKRWLRDGEILTTSIEGIGELRNAFAITAHADEGESHE
jgi:acylpyruvate hydrolase